MPVYRMVLVRWDSKRKKLDHQRFIEVPELAVEIEKSGRIVPEDEEAYFVYDDNGRKWRGTVDPDGNVTPSAKGADESTGFLGIYEKPAMVGQRVRLVGTFHGRREDEEYQIGSMTPCDGRRPAEAASRPVRRRDRKESMTRQRKVNPEARTTGVGKIMRSIRLYRWDGERGARDVRYWIDLAVGVDRAGVIFAANEEEDIVYFDNDDDQRATLYPDGKLYFFEADFIDREGFLGIYGKPARVGERVVFVEMCEGVRGEEEFEIAEISPYKALGY